MIQKFCFKTFILQKQKLMFTQKHVYSSIIARLRTQQKKKLFCPRSHLLPRETAYKDSSGWGTETWPSCLNWDNFGRSSQLQHPWKRLLRLHYSSVYPSFTQFCFPQPLQVCLLRAPHKNLHISISESQGLCPGDSSIK